MSYCYHMGLWDRLQRMALEKAKAKAVREHLEKMRAPGRAVASERTAARIQQAKRIVGQLSLELSA